VLLVASVAVSLLASVQLVVVLGVYVAVQLAYCFWLKHQAVLDICIVASGFLLRAIAGGAATGIPLSQWFLLVAGFGSLFMVAGKRYAEMMLAERTGAKIRKALENYTASYLRFVWALSATGADHHVLPVGVRHRRGAAQPHLVGDLDRPVRDRRCCATRWTSTRVTAASPRRSRWATACCRCWRCSGSPR
jgi:4-hydroxybenzoate polyprenyltransferase